MTTSPPSSNANSTTGQNTPPTQQNYNTPTPPLPSQIQAPIQRPEDIPFHPNAFSLTRMQASDFSKSLVRSAQNIAFRGKDEIVLTNHVKKALDEIRQEPSKSRWSQFITFLSSVILGISGQGFITEVTRFRTDPGSGDPTLTIIYGIVSLIMAVVATIAITR